MSLSDEADRTLDARAAGLVPADPYAADPDRPATSALRPWWRWLFLLPGLAAVVYGAHGLLTNGNQTPLRSWGTWFLGSALLNDVVLAPLFVLLGWLSAKVLPRAARPAVTVAAVVSGVLTLVALPFVLAKGRDPLNGSFLPRHYGVTLLVVVAVVWVLGALAAVLAVRRSARTG